MTVADSGISLLDRGLWVCNTVYHQVLAVVTFYLSYLTFKNYDTNNKITWHIFWSCGAYLPLMAEGIILFAESNTWTQYIKRNNKYYIHGVLLLVSLGALSYGIGVEIIEKNSRPNAQHFKSDHALTGFISWILCLASILLGLFSAYSQKLRRFVPPVWLKLCHNFFGFAGFAIGVTSLCLGIAKTGFSRLLTDNELNGLLWLIGFLAVYSVLEACRSMFNQVKAAFS